MTEKKVVLTYDGLKNMEAELENLKGQYPAEVPGRAAKLGDVANIDYVGTKDGEAFSGGTAEGFELAAMERRHIARVLEYTKGNKTETARLLKIGLTTLYRKIEEYKI